MRIDYAAHDSVYRQLKASGKLGWTDAVELRDILTDLETALGQAWAPRGGRAIELGCGAGEVALWLAANGWEAHGVDISPTAIEWAKEKASQRGLHVDFRTGNVVDLRDYPDGFFDLAVDGLCLHCIVGDDRARMLAAVRRVLRRGGLFHVRTMCGDPSPESGPARQFDRSSRCLVVKDVATRYLGTVESITGEIEAAGFQILSQHVKPRHRDDDLDDLLIDAAGPGVAAPELGLPGAPLHGPDAGRR